MGLFDYLDHFRPRTSNLRIDEILVDLAHDLTRVDRRYNKDRKKDEIHEEIEDLERQQKLIEHMDFWLKVRLVRIQDGLKRTQKDIIHEKTKEEHERRKDHAEKDQLLKLKAKLRYDEILKSDTNHQKELDQLRRQIEEGMRLLEEDRKHIDSIRKKLVKDNSEINHFRKKMSTQIHRDLVSLQHIRRNC